MSGNGFAKTTQAIGAPEDRLRTANGVGLAIWVCVEFRLKLVPASEGAGDCGPVEILEGKSEFLADLLARLNEIIRKPDGRYMVVYDPKTGQPRRIPRTD